MSYSLHHSGGAVQQQPLFSLSPGWNRSTTTLICFCHPRVEPSNNNPYGLLSPRWKPFNNNPYSLLSPRWNHSTTLSLFITQVEPFNNNPIHFITQVELFNNNPYSPLSPRWTPFNNTPYLLYHPAGNRLTTTPCLLLSLRWNRSTTTRSLPRSRSRKLPRPARPSACGPSLCTSTISSLLEWRPRLVKTTATGRGSLVQFMFSAPRLGATHGSGYPVSLPSYESFWCFFRFRDIRRHRVVRCRCANKYIDAFVALGVCA